MKKLLLAALFCLLATVAQAAVSPDGSTLLAGSAGSLTTAAGAWTIGPAAAGDSPILLNGTAGNQGAGIMLEVANGGQIYANTRNLGWWTWNGSAWITSANPSSSTPPPSSGMTLSLGSGSAGTLTGCPACVLTIPASSSNLTITSGDPACLSVSLSGSTVTITPKWTVEPAKTAAYPMTAADECSTIPFTGTAAASFTLPPVASLHNGWTVCWDDVAGTSAAPVPLTLAVAASPTIIYGGPTTYSWDQANCAQLDANNNWMLTTVVSAAIPNSNPFK